MDGHKEIMIRLLIAAASFFAGGGGVVLAFRSELAELRIDDAAKEARLANMEDHYREILVRLDDIQEEFHAHLVDVERVNGK